MIGTQPVLVIASDGDIAAARMQVGALAASIGASLVEQTKLVAAASELARNTLIHGGGGHAVIELIHRCDQVGLRLAFIDLGPGIPDVDAALVDGYSTGNGLGLGLGGTRRLVHDFVIDTRVGHGTSVTVCFWMPPHA